MRTLLAFAAPRFQLLGCMIAVVALAFACNHGRTVLTQLDDSRRLAANLRVQFAKAADASNRAVMADTDDASIAFARDAEDTIQIVERDAAALAPVLRDLGFANETRLLQDFGKHVAAYRELDRRILTLAVENTNLKAQALSFGPGRQAADKFMDSLATISSTAAAKDRCRVEGLAAQATLAVREIQLLQAPHIAASDDAAMGRMEVQMAELDARARDALKTLTDLAPSSAHSALTTALSALDQFKDSSAQIVKLSRRNSNVRSLELSLRDKPPLTAACDGSLRALEDALAKEGFKATR